MTHVLDRQRPPLCVHRTAGAKLVRKRHALVRSGTPHGIKRTLVFILLIVEAELHPYHEATQGTPRILSPAWAGDGRHVCDVASAEVWWETM